MTTPSFSIRDVEFSCGSLRSNIGNAKLSAGYTLCHTCRQAAAWFEKQNPYQLHAQHSVQTQIENKALRKDCSLGHPWQSLPHPSPLKGLLKELVFATATDGI